jgi:REP-associated tyrosine transposase
MTLEQFRSTAAHEAFAILAYCFMPDHVHLLVEGLQGESNLRQFAKMAKQRSGGAHQRRYGIGLWQKGYFERVVRDEVSAKEFVKYILDNPVRAGLATSPFAYPYVGSDTCTLTELVDGVTWKGSSRP